MQSRESSAWDTPLAQLLPGNMAAFDDDWVTSHVTLRDVILHRTGVSRSFDELWLMKAYVREDIVRCVLPPCCLPYSDGHSAQFRGPRFAEFNSPSVFVVEVGMRASARLHIVHTYRIKRSKFDAKILRIY